MGMGIWSMHFIGMLAFSVGDSAALRHLQDAASLVIAMVTSGFALAIASRPQLSLARLASGSIVMGAGICAMHYSGMAAIQIVPIITYQPLLVLASIGIAVGASFAALWLAFKLRSGQSQLHRLARAGAAVVMGLAISGMHYTAMAASKLARRLVLPRWRLVRQRLARGHHRSRHARHPRPHADHRGLRRAPGVADAPGRAAARAGQRRATARQEPAGAGDSRRRHFLVGARHREPHDAVDRERDRIAARGGRRHPAAAECRHGDDPSGRPVHHVRRDHARRGGRPAKSAPSVFAW